MTSFEATAPQDGRRAVPVPVLRLKFSAISPKSLIEQMRTLSIPRLPRPTLAEVFFAVLLLTAFSRAESLQALLADGDTGWHIRTGELVLASGRVPVHDPFSFSRAGQPWFAWEWLSDASFAALWGWKGAGGVAAACGVILSLAFTVLFARLLKRGVGLLPSIVVVMMAVSASSVHFLARPHVFSILLYATALWMVERDRANHGAAVWLLIPLTALWANLHAGFMAWIATVLLLCAISMTESRWAAALRYGALAAGCTAASLLTPYGWKLHAHVAEYLNSSWILDHVQEFQSPVIRSEGMMVYALMLLAAAAAAPRADRFEGVLAVLWGFASLRSARHVPLFAIAAAPVVATACAQLWRRGARRRGAHSAASILEQFSQAIGNGPARAWWIAPVAAAAIAIAPAIEFPASRFPVRGVERNLASLVVGTPRVLTSDQWADYLIYRLYPRQKVFFDGRGDFFGPAVGGHYRTLLAATGEWRELLERYGFDRALLPEDWPLSTMLEREPGWRRVYRDEVAVLYVRDGRTGR